MDKKLSKTIFISEVETMLDKDFIPTTEQELIDKFKHLDDKLVEIFGDEVEEVINEIARRIADKVLETDLH